MVQHQLDYGTPAPKPRPRASAGTKALVVLGLVFAGWGGIGALFVEGAVEHGDPSVSKGGVYFLLLLAGGGIAMIVFGIRRLAR